MLSAFIPSRLSYPAMLLAEQLVHQRSVHPGPLVLRTAPLKFPTPLDLRPTAVAPTLLGLATLNRNRRTSYLTTVASTILATDQPEQD